MATYRIFCYNPTGATISGTEQVGSIAAATGDVSIDPTKQWWNGPDEDVRYIVAYSSLNSERSNGPERVLATNYPCNLGFIGSLDKTDESFLNLAKTISGSSSLASASAAKTWLNTNGYWTSWISSSFDSDAQAFITAAAITNPTQQTAINDLVVGLKGYGIWTKMKALYPFVGGSATSHKFNLKDPRDLDAAFRLVFNGGWTHNSNGITGNATNAYADTFFSVVSNTVRSLSVYTRNSTTTASSTYIGHHETFTINDEFTYTNELYLFISSLAASIGVNNLGGEQFANNTNKSGFYSISNHTVVGQQALYKNGTLTNTVSASPGATGNVDRSLKIGALSNVGSTDGVFDPGSDSLSNYTDQNLAFVLISDQFITAAEIANLYTAVQAFQTTLGRQV